jgi:hypothetical protein
MMDLNLTSWAGATVVVMALVSAVKAGWKGWADGKEARLALALGVVVGLAARLTGAMAFEPGAAGWVHAVLGGVMCGIAAQVAHDKALNAIVGKGNSDGEVKK